MDKISRQLNFCLGVLLTLAALAACGSAEETQAPGETAPGVTVSITGNACPSVEINLNDQITWINEDMVEHPIQVDYPDGEQMVDLGVLQPGDSASVTFPQAGTFTYTCSGDPASTGTITVQP